MSEPSRKRFRRFLSEYLNCRLAQAGEPAAKNSVARARSFAREFFAVLRPRGLSTVLLLLVSLLIAASEMVAPLFVRFIIDRVLLARNLLLPIRIRMLTVAAITFLVIVCAGQLLNVLQAYIHNSLNGKLMLDLRYSLFRKLIRLPFTKLRNMKVGGILSRVTGDVEVIAGVVQTALITPSVALTRLTIALMVLAVINVRLALTAATVIPGVACISLISALKIRPIYRSIRKDVERIEGRLAETFAGIRIVRTFRREGYELLEYVRGRHLALRKELFAKNKEVAIWTSWGLLVGVVNVAIVWYGGYLYLRGRVSVGDIVAFQWYAVLLLNPVWTVVRSFSDVQRSFAAMEGIVEVLAEPDDMPDKPDPVPAPSKVKEIRFENVEFEYRPGVPVVREFDVVIRGGSLVALVGRSGAGKTTITDLMSRHQDPTRGRILFNGIDIRDVRLVDLRELFATVQQEIFLFDGTVAENIAYGRRNATIEEIETAARRAHAHEFIASMPEGYETWIGERGVKLSGGQQQRLAIARAFVANPEILILDEATSNLDSESERLIQASMADLIANRTAFVIAHRLSTVRRADLILVMDQGRIVERGNHDELMKLRGAYFFMVTCQFEGWQTDPIDALSLSQQGIVSARVPKV